MCEENTELNNSDLNAVCSVSGSAVSSICISYSNELVSSSGGEQPAVGGNTGRQNAVVVLEVQESVHRVSVDVKEAESPLAACRGHITHSQASLLERQEQ